MFKNTIQQTPFTTTEADNYFSHISGETFQYDKSFIATLRASLADRVPEGESVAVYFYALRYSKSEVSRQSTDDFVGRILNANSLENGSVTVASFTSYQEDNIAALEAVKVSYTNVFPSWTRLEKITEFFRKQFYILCFVEPENKKVVLFVDNLDIKKLHYIQCSIAAFMPWYFTGNPPVSEDEMSLFKSLREKTSQNYEAILARMAEKYDFRSAKIKRLLAGFETRFEEKECSQMRRNIESCDSNIASLSRQIGEWLNQRRDYEIRLLGLETKIASNSKESEIMDYFLCNKNITLESVNNDYIVFTTRGYLEYFDDDMAENIISNPDSYVYKPNGRACNNIIPEEDMKKLMTAIFIDQKLRIKFCAAYKFKFGQWVEALSSYSYGSECRECMPNTHIDNHSCLGTYESHITKLITQNNYIGAIAQCMASCASLNFGDSTVMKGFMKNIYGIADRTVNNRCIETPDGVVRTPKEAIAWLKEQEEQVSEQDNQA